MLIITVAIYLTLLLLIESIGQDIRCSLKSSLQLKDIRLFDCRSAEFSAAKEELYESFIYIAGFGCEKAAYDLIPYPHSTSNDVSANASRWTAVVDRGSCGFTDKALIAYRAGASSLVVVDFVGVDIPNLMGAASDSFKSEIAGMPVVMATRALYTDLDRLITLFNSHELVAPVLSVGWSSESIGATIQLQVLSSLLPPPPTSMKSWLQSLSPIHDTNAASLLKNYPTLEEFFSCEEEQSCLELLPKCARLAVEIHSRATKLPRSGAAAVTAAQTYQALALEAYRRVLRYLYLNTTAIVTTATTTSAVVPGGTAEGAPDGVFQRRPPLGLYFSAMSNAAGILQVEGKTLIAKQLWLLILQLSTRSSPCDILDGDFDELSKASIDHSGVTVIACIGVTLAKYYLLLLDIVDANPGVIDKVNVFARPVFGLSVESANFAAWISSAAYVDVLSTLSALIEDAGFLQDSEAGQQRCCWNWDNISSLHDSHATSIATTARHSDDNEPQSSDSTREAHGSRTSDAARQIQIDLLAHKLNLMILIRAVSELSPPSGSSTEVIAKSLGLLVMEVKDLTKIIKFKSSVGHWRQLERYQALLSQALRRIMVMFRVHRAVSVSPINLLIA